MKVFFNSVMSVKSALLLFLVSILIIACSGRLVKREQLEEINKKYSMVYNLKADVDIGNGEKLNKGNKVKIYIQSGSETLKVYAYPYNQSREEAFGKNILQMFEEDFTDQKFNRKVFEDKMATLLEEVDMNKVTDPVRKKDKKKKGKK